MPRQQTTHQWTYSQVHLIKQFGNPASIARLFNERYGAFIDVPITEDDNAELPKDAIPKCDTDASKTKCPAASEAGEIRDNININNKTCKPKDNDVTNRVKIHVDGMTKSNEGHDVIIGGDWDLVSEDADCDLL
ncbi:hypothetical protein GE09DRAFT_1186888 [Coniochaeta sp. 2T2.1]|nr:hypothetical protein GE09DRAFT_1186888 [Coniochaeta sp. 2T2.1]